MTCVLVYLIEGFKIYRLQIRGVTDVLILSMLLRV